LFLYLTGSQGLGWAEISYGRAGLTSSLLALVCCEQQEEGQVQGAHLHLLPGVRGKKGGQGGRE